MTLDLGDLKRVLDAVERKAPDDLPDSPPVEAEGLVEAMRSSSAFAAVRVRRGGGVQSAGGEQHWLDAGAAGVWSVDHTGERVTPTPVTGIELAERLAAFLGRSAAGDAPSVPA